jgi:hypothetical protein
MHSLRERRKTTFVPGRFTFAIRARAIPFSLSDPNVTLAIRRGREIVVDPIQRRH